MTELVCEGCKQPLTDCGPIGLECCNKDCTHDRDMVLKWLRQNKERSERETLARLKAKYDHE
jgi:hypothetical protein